MKKALSFILAVVLVASVLPFSLTASAATSGYYTYSVSNGKATITDVGTSISGNVTIPSKLGGYPVTSIMGNAFSYCTWLTSITIPESITSISEDAFDGCIRLANIIVEEGNTVYHSKNNCIIETDSKTLILGCKNSIIPTDGSVTSIGDYAFRGCTGLTSITIPNSVTSIGRYAFSGCTGLTSITIPNSVTSIGNSAFYGCTGLTTVNYNAVNCTSMGSYDYPVFKNCDKLTIVNIGEKVTTIPSHAFRGCTGLTNITIGNSVTSIGDYAFYNCAGLTSITISNSVTSIGVGAFNGCTGLTSITIPNSVTSIGTYAFYNCTGLENVWYTGSKNDKNYISIGSYNNDLLNATWHYNICNIDEHVYLSDCDKNCNNCKWVRSTELDHIYTSDCDTICNNCEWVREAKADHTYDYICSNDCNSCGAIRETVHTYDNSCDTTCNVCGSTREIIHDFEWIIDQQENCGVDGFKHEECAVCHTKRSENTLIPATGNHEYTNKLDEECNVCGYIREIEHNHSITTDETMPLQYTDEGNCTLVISDTSIAKVSDLNSSYISMGGQFVKVTTATISPLKPGYVLIQIISDSGEVLSETVVLITEGKKKSYGDLDGDGEINATDALAILHAVVGKIEFTDAQNTAGDVDGDGKISASDALLILHRVVGKIDKFPVEG